MKIFTIICCFFITQVQAEEQQALPDTRLAMGFYYPSLSNVSNKTDIQISLNYWVQELTRKIGWDNVYSVLYDDITDMNTAFQHGALDMVIAPPLLLAIHFDRELLKDGFMGVQHESKHDQLIIIAQKELNKSHLDYFGKRLLLPSNDLFAEIFLEAEVIKQYRLPYQQVFSSVNRVNKNQRIILDIFFGKADVAVVYDSALELMIEMNPQLEKNIRILDRFPIESRNYGYFHRDYKYQGNLKKEAKYFSSEPRGRQILEIFHSNTIVECLVSDLSRFDAFYRTYLEFKVNLKHE